ncbi:MAG: dnaG [Sedimentibacter sp.]|jgi:5S rRNA maturation endonuclease (ribonuclease M5)|nr:dnaG [Sedimentibacter sp.]
MSDIMNNIVKRGKLKKIKKMINMKVLLKAINVTTKSANIYGEELYDLCPDPKHKDSSPSWSINIEPESEKFGVHSCFSCGYRGNFITLTRDKLSQSTGKKLTNADAIEFIVKLFSLGDIDEDSLYGLILDEREQMLEDFEKEPEGPKESSLPNDEKSGFFKLLKPENKLYWNYLTKPILEGGRGIPANLIDKYHIGFCDSGLYRKRIIIPFWQEGKLISFLARSVLPTIKSQKKNGEDFIICPECGKLNAFINKECTKCDCILTGYVVKKARSRYPKGSTMEYMLWAYDELDYSLDYVILCEGAMDKLRLESLGYKNVMCVFGNKISDFQVELLKKFEQKIGKKLRVFLFPDADEGGDILIDFANQKIKYLFQAFVIELPWIESNPLDPGSATEKQIRIAVNTCEKLYKVYMRKFEKNY